VDPAKRDKEKGIDKNFLVARLLVVQASSEKLSAKNIKFEIFMSRRPIGSKTSRKRFCQAAPDDIA
jgi:hypothetical protein